MCIFIIRYLSKNRQEVADFLTLDQKVYNSKYTVSKEATLRRLSVNPYTDIIVKNEGDLVGYISLCPVDKEMMKKISKKEISEETIEKNILPYDRIGYYDAYLSSIVVDKEKYPKFPGKFLFVSLQKHIRKLRLRGIFIQNVIAVAVSKAGRRTLQKMRFSESSENVFYFDCIKQNALFITENPVHSIAELFEKYTLKTKLWGSV